VVIAVNEIGTDWQACNIFFQIYFVTHGIASLLADNAMVYDEAYCINTLSNAYFGTMYLIKEGRFDAI